MARLPSLAGGWSLRVVLLFSAFFLTGAVLAQDVETREFRVFIDGEIAGRHRMTIATNGDGSTSMHAAADVKVKKFGITVYSYTYSGAETWKAGHLQRLDSKANDNGKAFDVAIQSAEGGLQVTVNGQTRRANADAWLTTYGQAPPVRFRNQGIPLLDADTGKDIAATLQYLGVAPVTIAGQAVNCNQYVLNGGVKIKLWYDGSDRLVREESIEDGHTMILELTRLTKP
jgi:Domain of unknown function (DUF6134)